MDSFGFSFEINPDFTFVQGSERFGRMGSAEIANNLIDDMIGFPDLPNYRTNTIFDFVIDALYEYAYDQIDGELSDLCESPTQIDCNIFPGIRL